MSTETKKEPMTVMTLKEVVDDYLKMKGDRGKEIRVCIPNNKGGMGGTPVTSVMHAGGGIDWDASKFIIYPEVKMIEMPPAFTESEFQAALQRIKSLTNGLERLTAAVENKEEKELWHATRFAKNMLNAFEKSPIKPS